jgi:hypothetical protein
MARYKLSNTGVYDTETNSYIPSAAENADWREYLQWVDDGNTPDPQYTPQEILDNELRDRQKQRLETLLSATIDQFDLIIALFQMGVTKGIWTANDFPQEIRDNAVYWKSLVDDYKNEV